MKYTEEELINILINCRSFKEFTDLYSVYYASLREYTILIFDNEITNTVNQAPPAVFSNKLKSIKVVSTFKDSFCILNEAVFSKIARKSPADFFYKYCYNLDVNMMNVLTRFHNGEKDLEPIVTELNLFASDVTCFPYMIENATKISDTCVEKYAVTTLLIFNKFIRSSLKSFSSEFPTSKEDYENAKKSIELMKKMAKVDGFFSYFVDIQKYIYALLLKTTILSFQKNQEKQCTINDFLCFINTSLGIFLERETVFCCLYLKDHNNSKISKFFRGIHLNSKKIINTIRGMAWDLFHLRFCIEYGMANDINQGSICLHYFITQDNGLADLADAYPLKLFIYKKDDPAPRVIFDQLILETEFPEIDIIGNIVANKKNRMANHQKVDINNLISCLEKELLSFLPEQ